MDRFSTGAATSARTRAGCVPVRTLKVSPVWGERCVWRAQRARSLAASSSVSHVTEPAAEHLGIVEEPGNNHAMFGGRLAVVLGLMLVTPALARADQPGAASMSSSRRPTSSRSSRGSRPRRASTSTRSSSPNRPALRPRQPARPVRLQQRPELAVRPPDHDVPRVVAPNGQAFPTVIFQNAPSGDPNACFALAAAPTTRSAARTTSVTRFNQARARATTAGRMTPTDEPDAGTPGPARRAPCAPTRASSRRDRRRPVIRRGST